MKWLEDEFKRNWWKILGFVFLLGGIWTTIKSEIKANDNREVRLVKVEEHVIRHDEKINTMARDTAEIKQDVKEIRRLLGR